MENFQAEENEIDLMKLFHILWKAKWIIVSITSFVSLLGVVYSLSLPNIYESRAILNPADSNSSISRSIQNYAGLAGLAGINIPSGNDESNSAQAIQKLNSLSFFEDSIMPNIFLPDLIAVLSWNYELNKIEYNDQIYDFNSNKWVRNFSYPKKQIPSAQESFEVFLNQHFSLLEDKKTGFVTLSIKHRSPYIAKEWADIVINQINEYYRKKDRSESEKAVRYLNEQIKVTNLSVVKEVISELLQEETQKLALIEANQFYVFDLIDPPAIMEKKFGPNRSLICILISFFGFVSSLIFVFLIHYFSNKE